MEHVAMNVRDPQAVAKWYVTHLGFRVARGSAQPPFGHFLADERGAMIELYYNPQAPVPDYWQINPLQLHLAFTSSDVPADHGRLVQAGAKGVSGPETTPAGDAIAMLRDPWGVPIQLVQRAKPMTD